MPRRTDYFDDPKAPAPNSLVPAASAIVVNSANEILLHHRTDNALWSVPGGAVELGESILQTIVREVKKETGLDVRPGRVTGIYTDPRSVVAFADGEVRRFMAPEAIDDLAMSPPVRLRIRHYLEHRSEAAVT